MRTANPKVWLPLAIATTAGLLLATIATMTHAADHTTRIWLPTAPG